MSATPEFLLDLGYVSLLGGFAWFLLWSSMLRRERVGRVTTLAFAVPAMTTLIETIETGVIPSLVTVGGIGITFLGIYISRFREIMGTGDAVGWKEGSGTKSGQKRENSHLEKPKRTMRNMWGAITPRRRALIARLREPLEALTVLPTIRLCIQLATRGRPSKRS